MRFDEFIEENEENKVAKVTVSKKMKAEDEPIFDPDVLP
jgi:hypothetical protein